MTHRWKRPKEQAMRILVLILLLPLVDIASFVVVGPRLGVAGTLSLVLLSVFVGITVLRRSGLRAVEKLRGTLVDGRQAVPETIDAALLAIAGVLFIVPGFASDIIALFLLIQPIRELITRQLLINFKRYGGVVVTTEASVDAIAAVCEDAAPVVELLVPFNVDEVSAPGALAGAPPVR